MARDEPDKQGGPPGGRRRRESLAERQERRREIDDPSVVLDAAARLLEARARSVTETRRRLLRAGYRAELIEAAVARLVDLGVLDDEAFARAWVESRDRAHPRGTHVLRRELAAKGIDPAISTLILQERDGPKGSGDRTVAEAASWMRPEALDLTGLGEPPATADETAARRLIQRRQRALDRVPDPRTRRQRAYALLARNGFDPDVCRRVAAEVLAVDESADLVQAGDLDEAGDDAEEQDPGV